jgi:hypothetical protein
VHGRWRLVVPLAALLAACSSGTRAARPTGPAAAPASTAAATVPADFFTVTQGLDVAGLGLARVTRLAPASAALQGPHFAYAFVATATTSRLPPALAAGLGLAPGATPAPGHELVLTQAAPWPYGDRSADDALDQPDDARITVGSAVRHSPLLRADLSGTVVVSVPTGVHPVLRVTDEGRSQSLDLRTGRRGRDAVAGYYPTRTGRYEHGAPHDDEWVVLRLSGGAGGYGGAFVTAYDVRLRPWLEERGWAPPGRTWLLVEPSVAAVQAGTTGSDVTLSLAASSFRVTGSDGASYPLVGERITPAGVQTATGTLVAVAPPALRSVTLRLVPAGSAHGPGGPVSWTVDHGSQVVTVPLR